MGRIRYGLWLVDQTTAGARTRARAAAQRAATAGRELRWAAELSVRATTAQFAYARPEPWSDRKLLAYVTVIAVVALAIAVVLGIGMSQWLMTAPNSLPFAAAGALAVGVAFLSLAYLVFASKRGGR